MSTFDIHPILVILTAHDDDCAARLTSPHADLPHTRPNV